MTNLNIENITSSLTALTAKWEYIINLVHMNEFIIEKHQNKMPKDATNWLYSNMNLIEEFNILHEVDQIKEQLTSHTNHKTVVPLDEEIILNDNDLPF